PDYSQTRRTESSRADSPLMATASTAIYEAATSLLFHSNARVTRAYVSNGLRVYRILLDNITDVCRGLPSTRGIWNSLIMRSLHDRMDIIDWINEISRCICPRSSFPLPYREG